MKVKELIAQLKCFDENDEVLFSQDEELNCLRSRGEVAKLNGMDKPSVVLYGFDGSEIEVEI